MRSTTTLIISCALLLLTGAGCKAATQPETPSDDMATVPKEEKASKYGTQVLTFSDDPLALTGSALGQGKVEFSWNQNEAVLPAVDKYLLVYSEKQNPEHDGKNMWFRVDGSLRTIIWDELPAGDYFFRLCTVKDKMTVQKDAPDECDTYSNQVEAHVTE